MELKKISGIKLTDEQIANREYMFNKLIKDKRVASFLKDNNLEEQFLMDNVQAFSDWIDQRNLSDKCEDSEYCLLKDGYFLDLYMDDGFLQKRWMPCAHQIYKLQNEKFLSNYKIMHFPDSLINVTMPSIMSKAENLDYMKVAGEVFSFLDNPSGPGFYIHGDVGVGKTYLMSALTNELAKKGKTIAFVHTPTLINDLKNKISNRYGSIDNELYVLKNVDILVLDDIGSEGVSDWTRDDILLSILNYRMESNMTCFYTSNLSVSELYNHYAVNNRREVDKLASQRLLERIKMTSKEIKLSGENRRQFIK